MRRMVPMMFEAIVGMLQASPDGLSSVEIFNKLVAHGKLKRHLPPASSIGSVLKAMSKVGISNTSSCYVIANTGGKRKVSVWTLDTDRYSQWLEGSQ